MNRPGKGDTLSKLGMIGIGGAGLGSMVQGDAEREKRIKEEIRKAKEDDAAYDNKIKAMKAKQEHEREMNKSVAKKKLKESTSGSK